MKKMECIHIGMGMFGGMILGLLFAPKSGREMRKDMEKIMNKMNTKDIGKKIKEISDDLKKIDGEDVIDEVKKQVKKVNKKIDKLVDYGSDKTMNMIDSAMNSIS